MTKVKERVKETKRMQTNGMDIKLNDGKMVITIELDASGTETSTGKSYKLFSSSGWAKLPNGMKVNLGVIMPKSQLR